MEHREEDKTLSYESLCDETDGRIREERLKRFHDNINLVYYIGRKYPAKSHDGVVTRDDVFQEGFLGLWEACMKFDVSKGYEFSTFAVPYIRGRMIRIIRYSNPIKLPRWFLGMRHDIITSGFEESSPDCIVMLKDKGYSDYKISEYFSFYVLPLDKDIKDGENESIIGDITPDPHSLDHLKYSEEDFDHLIQEIVNFVPEYNDMFEEYLYANLYGYHLSQAEMASKYNISQPQVSRVMKRARYYIRRNPYLIEMINDMVQLQGEC